MFQNQTFMESIQDLIAITNSVQNLVANKSVQNLTKVRIIENLTKIRIIENLTITNSEKKVSLKEIHSNIVQRIKNAQGKMSNNPPTFKNVS